MKNDLEEKRVHGSLLFPFQYYTADQGRHGRPEIFVAGHWHDDVEILTVAKGTLQIMVDGRELQGEAGDIFFFNSGQIHQTSPPAQTTTSIRFRGMGLKTIITRSSSP